MSKMPKSLSLSRPVSSSGAMKSLDWQHRTTERSGSSIIAGMMKTGPRVPESKKTSQVERFQYENGSVKIGADGKPVPVDPIEGKRNIIIARIKREENRLRKLRAFGIPPIGRETPESQERSAKILRKEQVISRLMFELQNLNSYKLAMDVREDTRQLNKHMIESGLFVRLEKEIVPAKKTVLVHHRNVENRSFKKLTVTEQTRLAEIGREETKQAEIFQRKDRLKRMSMADIVKAETIRHKIESNKRIQEVDEKLREAFSDDDLESMFN